MGVAFMQVVFRVHTKHSKHLNLLPSYCQMSLNFLETDFCFFKFLYILVFLKGNAHTTKFVKIHLKTL